MDTIKTVEKLVADAITLEKDIQVKGLMASLSDVRQFIIDLDALAQALLPAPAAPTV